MMDTYIYGFSNAPTTGLKKKSSRSITNCLVPLNFQHVDRVGEAK